MLRFGILAILVLGACGPSVRHNTGDDDDTVDAPVAPPVCTDGATQSCYEGLPSTAGVGPCKAGTQTCAGGVWGTCNDQVIPHQELCGDSIDNNCNGMADEDVDLDGDGFTTCQNDCCDSTECTNPVLVNPGAYDAAGNMLDDDCDGTPDNVIAGCDTVGPSPLIEPDTTDALNFARAIDICNVATMTDKKWGVISAKLTTTDGTGTPRASSHAVRPRFGSGATPRAGNGLAVLSTGNAAAPGDQRPTFSAWEEASLSAGPTSAFPSDWYMANGNALPNVKDTAGNDVCPAPTDTNANDPIMLTLTVRVPTNAKSFKFASNFFSSEFPEYACSTFNDFFVVLLDSTYAGSPANPTDKNLAFYKNGAGTIYPVGVNLAWNNSGLFRQCVNGTIGCQNSIFPTTQNLSTCMGVADLAGTGMDTANGGVCDNNSVIGGATGWLETSGNVVGGEIITLRIAIWDTSDHGYDSVAVIDGFQWSVDVAEPGTVIFREASH